MMEQASKYIFRLQYRYRYPRGRAAPLSYLSTLNYKL